MHARRSRPAARDGNGIRERAMLHVPICAGLRVSTLTGLKMDEIICVCLCASAYSARNAGSGGRRCTSGWQPAGRSRYPRCWLEPQRVDELV